jgi:hypothetical protein
MSFDGKLESEAALAALGTYCEVLSPDRQKWRNRGWKLLDKARDLLPEERVSSCRGRPNYVSNDGIIKITKDNTGKAGFTGLETCNSVWMCPLCSKKISEKRRCELNRGLEVARNRDGKLGDHYDVQPVMLTVTAQHNLMTDLGELTDALTSTWSAVTRSKGKDDGWEHHVKPFLWGSIKALEVTHGKNGWHPHLHIILFIRAPDSKTAVEMVQNCRSVWKARLSARGFSSNEAGFQVQAADAAAGYISKWGAAEEMTLSHSKVAKDPNKGRNPWQLLADAMDGDKQASALFREYGQAFKGRKQLFWSKGLKDKCGIKDKTDDEVAQEEEERGIQTVMEIQHFMFKPIARGRHQAELLNIVENKGIEAAWRFIAKVCASAASGSRSGVPIRRAA